MNIMKQKVHIVWALVALVALGGGYLWGKASSARPSYGAGQFGASGQFGSSTRRFAANGQTLTTGQISQMDSSSITLQLPNGNSEVVFYSSSTEVTEPTTVPVSQLSVGSNVAIGATQNSDGSLTASSIQVRPAGVPGGNGGRQGGGQ